MTSTHLGTGRFLTLGLLCSSLVSTAQAAESLTDGADVLAEVVVTAQKQTERLQDVPVPVTAIDAQSLLNSNLTRVQDFYTSVPGLALSSSGTGTTQLTIRGLGTGGTTNPTVGIVLDDLPFGSSVALTNSAFAPDIDPNDLARIEVLRGPQGTLYGASSLGGLLKFVTVDPSTDGMSGNIRADANFIDHGTGTGYAVRANTNVPVSDALAVRISGFLRETPGYIDDAQLHRDGVNEERVQGGRLAALWKPDGNFTLKFSALVQHDKADGPDSSTLPPGGLNQAQTLPFGSHARNIQSYALTLNSAFGGVDLTSITGYNIDKYAYTADRTTSFFAGIARGVYEDRSLSAASSFTRRTAKFSQEIRFSGTAWQKLDWLLGLFYTHEDSKSRDYDYAIAPATLAPSGLILDDVYPTTYAEYAVFGDLTYHFTDTFDVQIGAREGRNLQNYRESLTGPIDAVVGLTSPALQPAIHTQDSSFTYLVTPRLKLTPDAMLYARIATGYRPGGPNSSCVLFSAPCVYQPDKTTNYELGLKAQTPDHRFSFDTSVYYIDWKDIQLFELDPASGAAFFANASKAKSQGVEFSTEARPWTGMTASAWVTWSFAVLTQGFPPPSPGIASANAVGNAGDSLPYGARWSGEVSLDQEFPLATDMTGFVGGSVNYVGHRESDFAAATATPGQPAYPRIALPAYARTDLRAGIHYDAWTASLYATNLTNRRGVLGFSPPAGGLQNILYIQPLTLGVSLARKF